MKIFLASLDAFTYLDDFDIKIRNAFTSYYYMRGPGGKDKMDKSRSITTELLVCDSGAHTFFSEDPEKGFGASVRVKVTRTTQTPDDYFDGYINFLLTIGRELDFFVELDIGEVVGQDKVHEWRERISDVGLLHKCITCYHPSIMTLDDYEEMCHLSESKYVAIEGDRPYQRKGRLDYTTLIKIARRHHCKVHGFAMTKTDALMTYPFYSVDSTSWSAVVVWGSSKIRRLKGKEKIIDNKFSRTGKTGYRGRIINLKKEIAEYEKLENYLTRLWERRGVVWTE